MTLLLSMLILLLLMLQSIVSSMLGSGSFNGEETMRLVIVVKGQMLALLGAFLRLTLFSLTSKPSTGDHLALASAVELHSRQELSNAGLTLPPVCWMVTSNAENNLLWCPPNLTVNSHSFLSLCPGEATPSQALPCSFTLPRQIPHKIALLNLLPRLAFGKTLAAPTNASPAHTAANTGFHHRILQKPANHN